MDLLLKKDIQATRICYQKWAHSCSCKISNKQWWKTTVSSLLYAWQATSDNSEETATKHVESSSYHCKAYGPNLQPRTDNTMDHQHANYHKKQNETTQ